MRLSQYFAPTLRELPKDADNASAQLMLRCGMIRKVAAGFYEWLPLGLKVLRKVESIIREEMDRAGGQEVWLPILQPKALWEETGRWQVYGKELGRFKDRKDAEFCIAPTAEEVITDLARREIRSYRELPLLLYQFGTKFRDEIRPRFGVMRAREFYMKDAYSFHADEASLDETYQAMVAAYKNIFTRCGLKFRPVEAQAGAIGGHSSHEFMVLADTGEETIASCGACEYAANVERAEISRKAGSGPREELLPLEEVETPGVCSVEDVAKLLKVAPNRILKALIYVADGKPVAAILRGDTELNEAKLQKLLGAKTLYKAPEEVYRQVSGCETGFAGPRVLSGARVVADHATENMANAVSGAGVKDKHARNVNAGRDFPVPEYADIRMVTPADPCPRCGGRLSFNKGIEVGHVFKLGTKYSEAMQAGFLDEKGAKASFIMGCYGIGVSRVVAAAIEQCHDADGILWPAQLAPFQVLVLPLNVSAPEVVKAAEKIYADLAAQGVAVLLDDRDKRAGEKFKDADLLGIPWRVTIGEKKLPQGLVEVKKRGAPASEDVPLTQVLSKLDVSTTS